MEHEKEVSCLVDLEQSTAEVVPNLRMVWERNHLRTGRGFYIETMFPCGVEKIHH
jgi:hypothetical protein